MSTATLTPSIAADDLVDELRQLLGRHDGTSTLDELEELADALKGVLRRTRGRITRLRRQAAPKTEQPADKPVAPTPRAEEAPAETRAQAPTALAAAKPVPRKRAAAAPAKAEPSRPAEPKPAEPRVVEIRPDRPLPPSPEPAPHETRPRRLPTTAVLILAALVLLWAVVQPRLARPTRRIGRAAAAAGRWVGHRIAGARRALTGGRP